MEKMSNSTVKEYLERKRKKAESIQNNIPETITINADILKTAPYSQRPVSKRWAEEIAAKFDPKLLDPLTVSYRDRKYFVIDGQHRLYAIRKLFGDKQLVNCKVLHGLTEQQEAEMFVKMNTCERSLNYADEVRALAFSGDKMIDAINGICASNGIEFGYEQGKRGKKDSRITALKTLTDIYEKIGAQQTERIIKILSTTWSGQSESLSAVMLSAMSCIMDLYGNELEDKTFTKKLAGIDPTFLVTKARNDTVTNAAVSVRLARIIVNYYNKGAGKKLPYRFGV